MGQVVTVNRLCDGRPVGAGYFSLLERVQTGPEAHTTSCLEITGDFSLKVMRLKLETYYSPHLVSRLKMSAAIPPLLHAPPFRTQRKLYLLLP